MTETHNPMPHPPFPSPDSAILDVIIADAVDAFNNGEVDIHGAVLHAAVYGWYEGHVEGEDVCPGCTHRIGKLPHTIDRAPWTQENWNGH